MFFRPNHPGQLFVNREAALAFEQSGYSAVAVDPARAKAVQWLAPKAPQIVQNAH
jgi:hypothetical protein